jgi:hypothetical protein
MKAVCLVQLFRRCAQYHTALAAPVTPAPPASATSRQFHKALAQDAQLFHTWQPGSDNQPEPGDHAVPSIFLPGLP